RAPHPTRQTRATLSREGKGQPSAGQSRCCKLAVASHRRIGMPGTINTQQALIYVMVTMSGVQGNIADKEPQAIGRIVSELPIFKGFDATKLTIIAEQCGE